MKKNSEEAFFFRFLIKGIFIILNLGIKIKLSSSTIKTSVKIFLLSNKNLNRYSFLFWQTGASLVLGIKLNEDNFFLNELIYREYEILIKRRFNFFWKYYFIKNVLNIFSEKKIKREEKFILKNLEFSISNDILIDFSEIFLSSLKKWKQIPNFFLKNFFSKILEKFTFFQNYSFIFYLTTFLSKECIACSTIWISISEKVEYFIGEWWRIFNTREAELEFFEQNFVFTYSLTIFKN